MLYTEKQKKFSKKKILYAFSIRRVIVTETGKSDTQVFYALIYNYVMPYYERDSGVCGKWLWH